MNQRDLIKQTKQLIEDFPPFTVVRQIDTDRIGQVDGYQPGQTPSTFGQMVLRIQFPEDDIWILGRHQVEKYPKESECETN